MPERDSQQPGERVGDWSNFRPDGVFRRKTLTENLDLSPSFHHIDGHAMLAHVGQESM